MTIADVFLRTLGPQNSYRCTEGPLLRSSIISRTLARFVLPAGAMLVAAIGCGPYRMRPNELTSSRLREVHGALLQFWSREGVLPDSLVILCKREPNLCNLTAPERWILDGWGRPLVYSVVSDGFVLRSAGKDGIVGSADDNVLYSALERSRVLAVRGCYRFDFSWWEPYQGEVVLLDTVPDAGGNYAVQPRLRSYRGLWHPLDQDSLTVSWIAVDVSLVLRLRRSSDSLTGVALGRDRRVVGLRTSCS